MKRRQPLTTSQGPGWPRLAVCRYCKEQIVKAKIDPNARGGPLVLEVFQSKRGKKKWFWRLRSANRKIVLAGDQGFDRESHARRAATSAHKAMCGVHVAGQNGPDAKPIPTIVTVEQ